MPERVIVQFGIYVFSPEERESFRTRIYTQIEREPESLSSNFKLQKPRSFYGYAQLMLRDWVVETRAIEYANQLLFEFTNDLAQTAILIYCSARQTRDNIIALSSCIPACVLDPEDPPIGGLWRLPYDRVVFKLFAETTLLVNTDIQEFANPCDVPLIFGDETYTPPPLSETDVPENELDPGFDIPTEPYDEQSNDFGETYNPDRIPEPIEGGGEDRNYSVTVVFTRQSYNSVTQVCTVGSPEGVQQVVRGPIRGLAIRVEPTFKRLVVIGGTGPGNPSPSDYSVATGAVNAPDSCNSFPTADITELTPL